MQIDSKRRPSFAELVQSLEEIKQRSQMAIVLADISNLNIARDAVLSKTILEKILGNLDTFGVAYLSSFSKELCRFSVGFTSVLVA